MENGAVLSFNEPNLYLLMGDNFKTGVQIGLYVKPTFYNRFRYWMFRQFFPFKVRWYKSWEEE